VTAALPARKLGIDTRVPYSDGWWLQRLYLQLRVQQKRCDALQRRYEGNAPLPFVSEIQRAAVKWFVEKSRTNFERVIVNAVLSRLRIRGIRTALDEDEGGDAAAFATWLTARGKLFTLDVHKMTLAMSLAYLIVGKNAAGQVLVTAEDPRLVTAITDPADPYMVLAALKLFHDDVNDQDVAYLYLPGRLMVARKNRKRAPGSIDVRFNAAAFFWDQDILNDLGDVILAGESGPIEWLAETDDEGNVVGGLVPVVPFVNEDGMAEFEPFLSQIDRINQQILQRMTIATIQAFKQRGFKGLPKTDPDTGEVIDYDKVFTADPGAIWNIPAAVEIWESGQVDFTSILSAIRDDVKDLYGTSGTPAYLASPDAANASAESASLQREQTTFKVESRQDRFEPSHQLALQLMFKTIADEQRSDPGKLQVIWAPAERYSMTERANAISQTKGVIPRYQQLTEIWGMDPAQADRAMTELTDDLIIDQQYAAGLKAATGGTTVSVGGSGSTASSRVDSGAAVN
jgi:hypothetical protein